MLQSSFVVVTIATVLLSLRFAHAAPGDLDPTFGTGGIVLGFPEPAGGADFVVQPDGRILVIGGTLVGDYGTITVARFESDGNSLDAAFGMGGVVTTPLGAGNDFASAIHLMPDGRFLVVGEIEADIDAQTGDMVLLRYLSDGTLDSSFGEGGVVRVSFGPERDHGNAIVVQPNGRIVIAGSCCDNLDGGDFALARLLADGSVDESFGEGGQVITVLQALDQITAMELQPDGKIVVGGLSGAVPNQATWGVGFARYRPDGSLDPGFGTGGTFFSNLGASVAGINAIALQEDGKIVGVGSKHPVPLQNELLTMRLDENGALDPTFGSGGVAAITAAGAYLGTDVVLQPDGMIVTAGMRYTGGMLASFDALVLRSDDAGALDGGFGTGGAVVTPLGGYDYWRAVARQQDGKILVLGTANSNSNADSAMARFEGTPAACGNGVTEPPEACDDLNVAPGDGCAANCAIEPGFSCTGMPSVCTAGCGDGSVGGSEECDDGGVIAGDGCDNVCALEPGWTCTGEPTSCTPVCGDSRIVGSETCDDGNTAAGDCCGSSCQSDIAGTPCFADDDFCTADVCDGNGACAHSEEPSDTCLQPLLPGKASLKILARGDNKDVLAFKWSNGPAVAKAEFGTPSSGTPQYGLCIYDETAGVPSLVLRALAQGDGDCADQECWTENTPGWRLKSKLGAYDGIVMLKLQEGVDGKSKVQVTMKKSFLVLPQLALASDPRVVVQVRSSDGQCYGAAFSTPTVNDETEYRAKSD